MKFTNNAFLLTHKQNKAGMSRHIAVTQMAFHGSASALTHSDGSGISESFLKIDTADADHWKGFDVLLCALM